MPQTVSYTVKVFIALNWVDKKKSWRIIDSIALCADVMSVTIKQVIINLIRNQGCKFIKPASE